MADRRTWQRINGFEIDPAHLAGTGEPLSQLLQKWDVTLDRTPPPAAPADGWRLLREDGDSSTIGAPQPDDDSLWWVATVRVPANEQRASETHFHDRPLPLERSRAEASRGLELRWPSVLREHPDAERLAIDVVNVGSGVWWPGRESFFVAARLIPAEAHPEDGPVYFGYTSGSAPAVALAPGDYARVRVTIPNWSNLVAGPHRAFATMPELGMSVREPLHVAVSDDQIERHRRRPPHQR